MSIPAAISPRDWSVQPELAHAPYRSTGLRAPTRALLSLPAGVLGEGERTGPAFGHGALGADDHDLTRNARTRPDREPKGERIIVTGHVRDDQGRPVPGALIEIWQANAAGRYVHGGDQHDAPLDPDFLGAGRCLTDADGQYRFVSLRPGAYPWGNHDNAWRPAHIHLSLFGAAFTTRLVTQMYFPGDPLFAHDPIFQSVPDHARERLVSRFSLADTVSGWALGYRFDIVLRGARATPLEAPHP